MQTKQIPIVKKEKSSKLRSVVKEVSEEQTDSFPLGYVPYLFAIVPWIFTFLFYISHAGNAPLFLFAIISFGIFYLLIASVISIQILTRTRDKRFLRLLVIEYGKKHRNLRVSSICSELPNVGIRFVEKIVAKMIKRETLDAEYDFDNQIIIYSV